MIKEAPSYSDARILSRGEMVTRYSFFALAYQGLSDHDHVYYASIGLDVDETISVEALCSDMGRSCPHYRCPDAGTLHHLDDLTFHTVVVRHYTDRGDNVTRCEYYHDAAYDIRTWMMHA